MRRVALYIVLLLFLMAQFSISPLLSIGYGGEENQPLILMGDKSFVPYDFNRYTVVTFIGMLTLFSTLTAILIARSRGKYRMRRRELEAINENLMQEIPDSS